MAEPITAESLRDRKAGRIERNDFIVPRHLNRSMVLIQFCLVSLIDKSHVTGNSKILSVGDFVRNFNRTGLNFRRQDLVARIKEAAYFGLPPLEKYTLL